MLERPEFPRPKPVMVINDIPVKKELELKETFSAVSNLNFLSSLRTGKVHRGTKSPAGFTGIVSTKIYPTYLDMSPFAEGNFDFKTDFCKRKDLQIITRNEQDYYVKKDIFLQTETHILKQVEFVALPHQKDTWISVRLYYQLMDLLDDIRIVKPKLIITTGKWTTFLLCGVSSVAENMPSGGKLKPLGCISKFRSSVMQLADCWGISDTILVPIIHPVHAYSMPDKVAVMEVDLQKVGWMYEVLQTQSVNYFIRPDKKYIAELDKEKILEYLNTLLEVLEKQPTLVATDVETMFHSTMDCIGLAYKIDEGICIPFASKDNPTLWGIEDEVEILLPLRKVLEHKNYLHVGQNYSYDISYLWEQWRLDVYPKHDTMILHHCLWNYLPKDLAFIASLHCANYVYWKGEVTATKEAPETRWTYNAKDCAYTLEVCLVLLDILSNESPARQEFYKFKVEDLLPAVIRTTRRGVLTDIDKQKELRELFTEIADNAEAGINYMVKYTSPIGDNVLNIRSSTQVKKLFKEYFLVDALKNRKTGTETFGSDAMLVYLELYPLLRPFIVSILEYRSINVFLKTFLSAKVDYDNHMRSSYNVSGTATDRLSSRKNSFGNGMNLQNVPAKGKINLNFSLQKIEAEEEENNGYLESIDDEIIEVFPTSSKNFGNIVLPNCKKLFICAPEETFFDIDLASADARVIAWTSNCKFLIDLFQDDDADLYAILASEYTGRKITRKDPERQSFKAVAHASNYNGKSKTIAAKEGMRIADVEKVQRFYFHLCPEIPKLQEEVVTLIRERGYLENCWGSRGYFLNSTDPMLLNKALAWVGSSPVSTLINKGFVAIDQKEKDKVAVRLQVHDSLAGTFKTTDTDAPRRIVEHCTVPMPFHGKLYTIPVNIKTSTASYGDCE